ncbi:MAG: hypothetical protein ABSG68_22275 [Thermoguttaceae bacterium]
MKMDERRRIRTSKRHGELYRELKGTLVQEFHELFFLSACVGFRNQCPAPLGRMAEERFWSDTITRDEWSAYRAMILSCNDMDFNAIQDEKAVIEKIEEYAHGGMLYLIENVLNGFLVEKDGDYAVDKTVVRDLPRRVMHYVFETASNG